MTKSSKYTTSISVKTTDEGNTKVGFSVPLKHLSNFWRALDMPLISCEISLTLTYSKSNNWWKKADPNADPPVLEIRAPTDATFKMTDTDTHPSLFLMGNIKPDLIPTKIRRLNKENPPTLLLVLATMSILGYLF